MLAYGQGVVGCFQYCLSGILNALSRESGDVYSSELSLEVPKQRAVLLLTYWLGKHFPELLV